MPPIVVLGEALFKLCRVVAIGFITDGGFSAVFRDENNGCCSIASGADSSEVAASFLSSCDGGFSAVPLLVDKACGSAGFSGAIGSSARVALSAISGGAHLSRGAISVLSFLDGGFSEGSPFVDKACGSAGFSGAICLSARAALSAISAGADFSQVVALSPLSCRDGGFSLGSVVCSVALVT
jgi:hypothetical protein